MTLTKTPRESYAAQARKLGISRQRFEQKRHPESSRAREAVRYRVMRGVFPRPDTLSCSDCGNVANVYYHHRGYVGRARLDVIPLCQTCIGTRPRQYDAVNCWHCNQPFTPSGPGRQFCSDECSRGNYSRRHAKSYPDEPCDGCGTLTRRRKSNGVVWCSRACMNRTLQARRNRLRRWQPELFRASRERLGLSQQALAERIGVSQSQVAKWEVGIDPPPVRYHDQLQAIGIDLSNITPGGGARV